MNKIDLIYKRSKWRPSLVMCVNNMVIKQNIAAFRANPIPTYLAWTARWFVRRNPDHIHYFDLRESEAFLSDAAKGFGSCVTVPSAALQLAYYMGDAPVIIVGVDHAFDTLGGCAGYEKRIGEARTEI